MMMTDITHSHGILRPPGRRKRMRLQICLSSSTAVSCYRPQTKLRKGNVFTSVCLPQCMLGYTPLGRHPQADTPPTPTPSRRLLQQTVRILLECILVFISYLQLIHRTYPGFPLDLETCEYTWKNREILKNLLKINETRMHSSGIRTARLLTVYLGGGVSASGPGGVYQHAMGQRSPPPVDRQTPVKT